MNIKKAVKIFSALSQETRLSVLQILAKQGHEGLPAGVIGAQLGVPHNTLSFHLSHLERAGLVQARRQSRLIIYSANFESIHDLTQFLLKFCKDAEK